MPEPVLLSDSFAYCRRTARTAARNFYYGFRLLPAEKRDALCALYTFMRGVDDISDEPGDIAAKTKGLAQCRAQMDRALAGDFDSDPVWPAFREVMARYRIPTRYLHDLISGAEMDLTVTRYETFDRLREYCYRVAGTVGLCCLCVFGYQRSAGAGAGGNAGDRVSAHQYSSGPAQRLSAGPDLPSGRGSRAISGAVAMIWAGNSTRRARAPTWLAWCDLKASAPGSFTPRAGR
jgi:phytoene/squalene synthetase